MSTVKYKLNILSQVDHDPLCRVKGLKKLECFNKKRFKELKDIFKEIIGSCDLINRREKKEPRRDKAKIEEKVIDEKELERDIFCIGYRSREDVWEEEERWDMVIDFENYWGDLSIDEEYQLSRLLKGRDNIIL